jgi:hypothetical protein
MSWSNVLFALGTLSSCQAFVTVMIHAVILNNDTVQSSG